MFLSDSVIKIVHVNEMFRLITLSQVIRDWQAHVRFVLNHRTQSAHIREKRLDESKAHSLLSISSQIQRKTKLLNDTQRNLGTYYR